MLILTPPFSALQARLAELSSEDRSMRHKDAATETSDERDSEVARSHEREEYRQEREQEYEEEEEEHEEMEEENSYDELEAQESDETKGVLLRFLQGIQPVSYLYWEN